MAPIPASFHFIASPFDLVPRQPHASLAEPVSDSTMDDRRGAATAFAANVGRSFDSLSTSSLLKRSSEWVSERSFEGSGGDPATYELLPRSSTVLVKRASLDPSETQKVTLGVIAAYVVIIAILWNLPYIKWVLYPLKMLTIAFHEFGHAATGCCTGARIKSITLDPREGGCTLMSGGISAITLPAGYLGSSLIGALLIFCGFDIIASKIASFVLAGGFLITLWWGRKDWLVIGTILVSVGLLIAGWFIAHGAALRYEVLFIGVMSALYSIWDIFDDLILRKVNESDASVFAKRYGGSSACWGVLWAIVSLLFMIAGILCGLLAFKESFSEQATQSADFLPTRLLF